MLCSTVVGALKGIFARHGIPEMMISDNGPQYIGQGFKDFTRAYGFKHVTSSPRYPQGNGAAERAVQTVKRLLTKSVDPHLAILAYRTSPLENGFSPAELLMGRKLRSTIRLRTNPFFRGVLFIFFSKSQAIHQIEALGELIKKILLV